MNEILKWAALLLIRKLTDEALDQDQVSRVKNLIVSLSTQAIDNTIKHKQAAALIKTFAEDMSENAIDWTIRTILWVARATGQISPVNEVKIKSRSYL